MSSKQEEIYKAYQERLKKDILEGGNNILGLLTRLRQVCITPELLYEEQFENTKIDMAMDLIRSSISANHRILLFSQFAQSFPLITKRLEAEGIKYYTLDGTTKSKDRVNMVNSFNEDSSIKVFIISLKAGGTGLNLVGADMVLHLDPWWNSSAELQATDRAHRIGQTKNVYVIKLICKNTIEEKVLKLQEAKKELAYSIINSDVSTVGKITKEEILKILE
jgi:SNF2 family DNA or RNA helicase